MTLRFGSVCSGIEAASVAWKPLGWQAAWFSEIEPFPSAVLAHHYPTVPNLGSLVALPERVLAGEVEAPDLLCGGTPCQAFSVAGLRRSLDDARGNLSLTFCELADAIDTVRSTRGQQPAIVFWENVPGCLSTSDNFFGCFLGRLAGSGCELQPPGRRWSDAGCVLGPARAIAWRILDAQYFGVAQRRRRVYVCAVGYARAGFDPAAVLFECEGVRRDSAPSRQARQDVAASAASGAGVGGVEVAPTLDQRAGRSGETTFATSGGLVAQPYTVANCLTQRMHKGINTTLDEGQTPVLAHAFDARQSDVLQYGDKTGPLDTDGHSVAVMPPYVKATNPHSADEAPRFEPAQVAACLNGWDERHDPPKHLVAHAFQQRIARNGRGNMGEVVNALQAQSGQTGKGDAAPCVATGVFFAGQGAKAGSIAYNENLSPTLKASDSPSAHIGLQVRRLTPRECERLQGFPDDYTAIRWRGRSAEDCPDGPRYKALGNSWAVPVVHWIGARIQQEVSK